MALTAPTADLTGNTIADTYDQLLILDNAAGIVENTLKIVSTQLGRSALQLDDEKVLIKGVDTSNAAAFEVQQTGGTSIFKIASDTPVATLIGALTVGSAGSGHDVTFYSGTSGDQMVWDSSEEVLNITGTDGQTSLDVLDGDLRVVDKIYLYDRGGEYISSNGTALTLNSGEDINLTCATGDVNIPVNIGLRFGDGNQHIETDNTDLTITSDVSINLSSPQVDLLVDTNFVTTGGVNGMSIDKSEPVFNGMDCLAAQMFVHFKTEAGNIYCMHPDAYDIWEEYVYEIEEIDKKILITVYETPPAGYDGLLKIFHGTPKELLTKIEEYVEH